MKLLHSADWHLDSPFTGFSPEQRAYLKSELRKIPEKVADICRREECDLMLLSGDIFDGPASPESIAVLRDVLTRCGIPVFISPGNHDYCAPGSPWLNERWPENVYIFKGDLESVSIPALDCRIYGAGYRSMDCPGLLEGFRIYGQEQYHVAVLHGDPVVLSSPCCPVTAAQVRDSGLHYLAMGHIHKAGFFHAGCTHCAWPGSPMGRGFDETGEKGVYVVELEGGVGGRLVPLDTPWFFTLELDTENDAVSALQTVLPGAGNRDFYRITLTGQSTQPLSELSARFSHFPNLTLIDRREAETNLWENVETDTLEGTYFRLLRESMEGADPETAHQIQMAAEISRKLLAGKEVILP